jgi:restriction endonuclease S subunit
MPKNQHQKTSLGGDGKPISEDGAGHAENSERVYYHKLRSPEDVLAYVQWAINALHREKLAFESDYLGKVIYLLNTWLAAYKINLENVEVKQIREEIAELRRQQEARDGSIIRVENR